MKTAEEISQWVIDNRYPKWNQERMTDTEMYHLLLDMIVKEYASQEPTDKYIIERAEEIYQSGMEQDDAPRTVSHGVLCLHDRHMFIQGARWAKDNNLNYIK